MRRIEVDGGLVLAGKDREPSIELDGNASEFPVQKKEDLKEIRRMVEGLTSVGVSVDEAIQPFQKDLSYRDLIALVADLVPNGPRQMIVLGSLTDGIKDKAAFGQACLEAGFSPVGVALARLRENEDGHLADIRTAHEVRSMILEFNVDVGMADCVKPDYGFRLGTEDLVRGVIKNPTIFPFGLVLDLRSNKTIASLPWLLEVGGALDLGNARSPSLMAKPTGSTIGLQSVLRFPNLRRVCQLYLGYAKQIAFPALVEVEKWINARHSQHIDLPALKHVGGDLDTGGATIGFKVPSLISVNGQPFSKEGVH